MDELLKIPPITRTLVGLVLLVSVGPILGLANPYTFLLWWPAILKKQQIWRLVTCFFLEAGGNMQVIFDLFMLGRNTMELELNHFHRSTADFTWALMVMGFFILATNYPLGSTVLFKPMLMAINYLWARSNAGATVSLFGVVSCPASLLPYAYLSFDLILGGLPLFIQSSTGLLSAYLYHQLRHDLPSNGGPRLIPTPGWLQRALPPSVDPANAGTQARRDGQVLGFGGGTMFAPRGRSIGDGSSSSSSSSSAARGASWSSFLPSFLQGGGAGSSSSSGSGSSGTSRGGLSSAESAEQARKRSALFEATEKRLRAQRENSIAGRNAAAAATAAAAANAKTSTMTSSLGEGKSVRSTAVTGEAEGSTMRARTVGGSGEDKGKGKSTET